MRHQRLANATDLTCKGEGRTGPGSTGCQPLVQFPPRTPLASWAWTRTHWTDADKAALRAACDAAVDPMTAADHLGRTPKSIAWQARGLGLEMPAPWRNLIVPKRMSRHAVRLAFPYVMIRRPENELLLFVNSLVPPALPEWIRADICQNVILEILEGKLDRAALNYRTVSRFIRRTKRENWDYQTISLDRPLGHGTDTRLIDIIADDPERVWQ